MTQKLSSLFADSRYHMADVTAKRPTLRRAVATGRIIVGETGFACIKQQSLPKGDVLKLAEIAGVQGAKETSRLIPLCHPLPLDHVEVCPLLEEDTHSVAVYARVQATAKTGVEMETLAAVNAALLTIYDLVKPVEPALVITDVRVLVKEGGKKGRWTHPQSTDDAIEEALSPPSRECPLADRTAAVITLSDRASRGEYQDRSGPALKTALEQLGCLVPDPILLPDEPQQLQKAISSLAGSVDLIFTTGGTGLAPRDTTPETLAALAQRQVPGFGELLRASAANHVPTSWLSRSLAVIIDNTLVIALPGSVGAVKDGVEALQGILAHALDHVRGDKDPHHDRQEADA